MDETELVTNFMAATIPSRLHPDSLLTFTRRAIVENPFLTGMAISMEPNFFPEKGRYYSAYSLRDRTPGSDSIHRVRLAHPAGWMPTMTITKGRCPPPTT